MGAIVRPERRGTAVGVLPLGGDVGGTLGPLSDTAPFAGSLRAPQFATAVLLAAFVPFAIRPLRASPGPA